MVLIRSAYLLGMSVLGGGGGGSLARLSREEYWRKAQVMVMLMAGHGFGELWCIVHIHIVAGGGDVEVRADTPEHTCAHTHVCMRTHGRTRQCTRCMSHMHRRSRI